MDYKEVWLDDRPHFGDPEPSLAQPSRRSPQDDRSWSASAPATSRLTKANTSTMLRSFCSATQYMRRLLHSHVTRAVIFSALAFLSTWRVFSGALGDERVLLGITIPCCVCAICETVRCARGNVETMGYREAPQILILGTGSRLKTDCVFHGCTLVPSPRSSDEESWYSGSFYWKILLNLPISEREMRPGKTAIWEEI